MNGTSAIPRLAAPVLAYPAAKPVMKQKLKPMPALLMIHMARLPILSDCYHQLQSGASETRARLVLEGRRTHLHTARERYDHVPRGEGCVDGENGEGVFYTDVSKDRREVVCL